MFIGNIKYFSDDKRGLLTKEDILRLNPPYVEISTVKPACNPGGDISSLIYHETIRIFRDGRIERKFPYICQTDEFEHAYILNPIGRKMLDYVTFKEAYEERERNWN
jgi:hypothetical protein